jgi:Tfp pilus assembly protein PilX
MSRAKPPRGMISVAALVCLLVMTLICGSLLRTIQTQRALVRSEERRLQAEWLAESGLERAYVRLANDPAYTGETWTLSADQLGGMDAGSVTISVGAGPEHGGVSQRLVSVQADYPGDPPRRVRVRRQATVEVAPQGREAAP